MSEPRRRTGNIRRSKPKRRYYDRRSSKEERRKPPTSEVFKFDALLPSLVKFESKNNGKSIT